MWFFKKSALKKAKEEAKLLISLGKKVYDYRRDILSQSQCDDLLLRINELKTACASDRLDDIKHAHNQLHKSAVVCGGKMYPVTFWSENVEMLLVAAILALGIRSFFVTPFKIPTNSMYPTYSGMIEHVYEPHTPPPSFFSKITRFAFLGASSYEMLASTDGQVAIPLFVPGESMSGSGAVYCRKFEGRKWLGLLPQAYREYVFYVNGKESSVVVPWDFRLDDVVMKAFFPQSSSFREIARTHRIEFIHGHPCILTDFTCKAGEPVLRFDILTGDMVFVNTCIYNFVKPKIGESFVFRTGNIAKLNDDKYYIKRLVGMPGDTLEVREPVLYRNGSPITGAEAFELNFNKTGEYRGYTARGDLSPGKEVVIPPHHFYAMGDNSPYSGDSRYWGPVPEKEVVGKPLFILHPFTKRWGLTK